MTGRLAGVRAEDAFDVTATDRWLRERLPGLAGSPEVLQFAGGASNLTYLLRYQDRELVLRRPPHGTKAASAHDMRREVTVQTRLRPHLPFVPEIYAFCDDPAVIGSEFYVMERLHGTILGPELPEGVTLDEGQARGLAGTVLDGLADLHSVDVRAAGLAELGKGPGYVRRQIDGWSARYRAARTDDVPDGDAVMRWLADHQPHDVAARLIHGDWKFDNIVLDLTGSPRLVGVLDWEMSTVGDPLMDLGASTAYWITAADEPHYALLRRQPTHLPGMPTREQVVERYLARTGLELPAEWRFYEVYGLFRLAVIAQQIYYRFKLGQTKNPRFAAFGVFVSVLSQVAERVIDKAAATSAAPSA